LSQRDRAVSILARYLTDVGRHAILSRDQEMEIGRAVGLRGDTEALHRLIESNLAFVIKVASEYRNRGLPFEDLVSEGNVGLLEAARRYDHARGVKFITYAVWWIRKAILKALAEQSGLVRVPRYQQRMIQKVREAEASLAHSLGRPPSREEISSTLESTVSEVDRILLMKSVQISLDEEHEEEDGPRGGQLADPRSVSPEEELLRGESQELLRSAVRVLNPQERTVIARRMGMQGRPSTLKEIGETMGVTRERIRQIEEQATKKLRGAVEYLSSPPRERLPKPSMDRCD
jgi:RNA polymerase primary sigma factor